MMIKIKFGFSQAFHVSFGKGNESFENKKQYSEKNSHEKNFVESDFLSSKALFGLFRLEKNSQGAFLYVFLHPKKSFYSNWPHKS